MQNNYFTYPLILFQLDKIKDKKSFIGSQKDHVKSLMNIDVVYSRNAITTSPPISNKSLSLSGEMAN